MTTYRAVWKGQVLAESDRTVKVEGNQYFPADSVRREFFSASDTHTTCPWKGLASYYSVTVDGQVNRDAAWYYPQPSRAAESIRDSVAFWHGVKVQKVEGIEGAEGAEAEHAGAAGRPAADAEAGSATGTAALAAGGPASWWQRVRLRLGSA